ncbi:MAG: ATP-binding protein [Anaerolineae bacterium]|nr:ATP-binding protein [Anaerolineae bacterium]
MGACILIRGPLGVGKTTVARALAEQVGGLYVSVDGILAEHGLDKVEGECISPENFIKANELALPQARQALSEGRVVVFDGNFYHRAQIDHLVDVLPEPHYAFTLKSPLTVCIDRDSERPRVYGVGAATAVHTMVSRFDYGVSIDTSEMTLEGVLEALRGYLPETLWEHGV